MINISFDRAYLLLIAIPLLAVLIIPFAIAIRKENRSKSVILSLVLHLVIAALITFAAAGTEVTAVITETHVYVLADVSYSANRNLDQVDKYVRSVEDALPDNSKMGVIAFGKDSKLVTPLDGKIKTVQNSGVDESATDIRGALNYAASLFEDGVIRRIVLITDGKQTYGDSSEGLVGTIEQLYQEGIYIDAIYLDDNLAEDAREVQVSGVEYTASTYLNHATTANVLLQSGSDNANVTVTLYCDEEELRSKNLTLTRGFNFVEFGLPTEEEGIFHYRVTVAAEEIANEVTDYTAENNGYTFTQTVSGRMQVLLITANESDVAVAEGLYGEQADVTSYVNTPNIPFSVEDLIQYDEILLSEVDVGKFNNYKSFISSLDTVVSQYGKSLVTMGNMKIQNNDGDALKDLEDMLPVKYGNGDQDPKHLVLVLDTSRSMEELYRLEMTKKAAIQMIELMNEGDLVSVVAFSGDISYWQATVVGNKSWFAEEINKLQPTQGTVLDLALKKVNEELLSSDIANTQVMLISDGKSYLYGTDDPVSQVAEMRAKGVKTSVINTNTKATTTEGQNAIKLLTDIAKTGEGNYYFVEEEDDLTELILTEVGDDITQSEINAYSPVRVKLASDDVLDGIEASLPALNGFVYAKAKGSATTVLTTDFQKTSGSIVDAPIYTYWSYGSGKVSTFTSSLSGAWSSNWTEGSGKKFFENVLAVNTPEEKRDYPFSLFVENEGKGLRVSVEPSTLNYDAKTTAEITMPNGETLTQQLIFNATGYYYEFETPEIGKYTVKITYEYPNREPVETTTYFDIPYTAEYDSFTVYNVSDLHKAIRTRGNVYTDGNIRLVNDEDDVASYTFYLTLPFMIAAAVIFVADVVIRKLRWADIRNLFGLREKKNARRK